MVDEAYNYLIIESGVPPSPPSVVSGIVGCFTLQSTYYVYMTNYTNWIVWSDYSSYISKTLTQQWSPLVDVDNRYRPSTTSSLEQYFNCELSITCSSAYLYSCVGMINFLAGDGTQCTSEFLQNHAARNGGNIMVPSWKPSFCTAEGWQIPKHPAWRGVAHPAPNWKDPYLE